MHHAFQKDLREAKLPTFPDQRNLETPLDEVLWMLWVMRDHFDDHHPMYASEIAELLEIRSIASSELNAERALARAGNRVMRKKFNEPDDPNNKTAYKISEKGVSYLQSKYALSGIKALVVDGTKPWTDRHLTLPEIAAELKGRICVVDKFYGSGSLSILHYFKHGTPLQFLTGKTHDNSAAFSRELKDFQKEVPALEARLFSAHNDLHDRYIISDNALVIVGHGIKDMGNKESFLILLKGDSGADLRKTLLEKFDNRWKSAALLV
jgi:hypothetical protein